MMLILKFGKQPLVMSPLNCIGVLCTPKEVQYFRVRFSSLGKMFERGRVRVENETVQRVTVSTKMVGPSC